MDQIHPTNPPEFKAPISDGSGSLHALAERLCDVQIFVSRPVTIRLWRRRSTAEWQLRSRRMGKQVQKSSIRLVAPHCNINSFLGMHTVQRPRPMRLRDKNRNMSGIFQPLLSGLTFTACQNKSHARSASFARSARLKIVETYWRQDQDLQMKPKYGNTMKYQNKLKY